MRLPLVVAWTILAVLASACTAAAPDRQLSVVAPSEAATQAPGRVDVTVYFRSGTGAKAYLVPVVREVPIGPDLIRVALESLLAGPRPEDGSDLHPALPTSARVLDVSVEHRTARVDLSEEVITDARSVGRTAEHEALALAAVANTATGFPDVDRVELTVDGRRAKRFWGAWGVPDVLVRDDSVLKPPTEGANPGDVTRFSARTQRVGTRAPRVEVVAVLTQPRAAYVRVVVEFEAPGGERAENVVPRSVARRRGDAVVLDLSGVRSRGLKTRTDKAETSEVRIQPRPRRDALRIVVRPNRKPQFALQTLTEPARLVLDVRS